MNQKNKFVLTNRQHNLSGGVLGKHLLDGDEVLQALGHLAPGDGQVARVEEVPGGLCVYGASNMARVVLCL